MNPKVMLTAVAALALVATTGCASAQVLGEDDSGKNVTLSVGEQLTIELPSNITTGYSWSVADDGGLQQVGEALYEAPDTDAVGAGGTETFTFEATEPGAGELVLWYARPWESVQPAETWSVTVEVE